MVIWSSNPTPRDIPRQKYNSRRYMHPYVHVALFTKAKTCKEPKRPLRDEWIKTMWYIYTMEYYSAIKRIK